MKIWEMVMESYRDIVVGKDWDCNELFDELEKGYSNDRVQRVHPAVGRGVGGGGVMCESMLETEACRILNEGIEVDVKEAREGIALLSTGKLGVKEISDYTGLEIEKIDEIMRIHKLRGALA